MSKCKICYEVTNVTQAELARHVLTTHRDRLGPDNIKLWVYDSCGVEWTHGGYVNNRSIIFIKVTDDIWYSDDGEYELTHQPNGWGVWDLTTQHWAHIPAETGFPAKWEALAAFQRYLMQWERNRQQRMEVDDSGRCDE